MKNKIYFGTEKNNYKGNTHFHTILSDGSVTTAEAVSLYKEKGYSFIIWSDHDIYLSTKEFDSDDFITIGGAERGGLNPYMDVNGNDNPGFHFGCIEDSTVAGCDRYKHMQKFKVPVKWEGVHSVTDYISDIKSKGNLVVLNHPEWHMTAFDSVIQNDYFAIEIYNYATEWTPATCYGTAYLDHALQNGKRCFAIAADDAHSFNKEAKIPDYAGGWIVVNSDSLDSMSIIRNMKEGNFYSSSGPEIYEFKIEDGKVVIKCSPCKYVMFKSWPERGNFLVDLHNGKLITEASQVIGKHMKYIRVECIDENGQVAWTNPIFLDDRQD